MSALRHADVRIDDKHAPCPFCGCGLAPAAIRAPRRPSSRRMRYTGPAIAYEQLPPEWQRLMRSPLVTRTPSKEEERVVASLNAARGKVAVVDAERNAVRFEESAA